MKKIVFAICLIISGAVNAQRMLVLPDTPQYANLNRGVWVFRIANGIPYYSNGVRWVANTGGLGPQTISDSLTAFQSRVVTSYNGFRGPVKGVDSIWFTNLGTVLNWRYNGVNYNQLITGTGSVPDSNLFATVNYVNSNFATLSALNTKLNIGDTANKWVSSIFKIGDTLKYRIGNTIYNVGLFGGAGVISDVFGRTGSISALSTDYSAFYPLLSGSYNNPSWINTLAWSKITGVPTLSGIDSGAYRTLTQINDSIITFNRANGAKDTLVIEVNSGSGGGGSGTVTQFNFTNSTGITGTVTNATTTPTLSLLIDTGAIANFAAKARSLFGGTYPIQYNNGLFNLDTTAGRWRSENYYNTKYLQNITGLVTQGAGISITGSGTSGSPYVVTATGANADSTAAKIKRGTYAQRPLNPDTGQIYWQTDRLAGEWKYDGRRWNFSPEWNKVEWAETFTSPNPLVPKIAYLASGTGADQNIIRERKFSSYLQLTTGTTTTGYSSGGVTEEEAVSPIVLDSMIQYREWLVRLPVLSNGTDTYEAAVGWLAHQSQWNFGTLLFIYSSTINGGNWSTRTRKFDNSANVTTKNSGVAAVANTWTKLAIEVNGYTETIYFYINDVLVTTHSTANGDNIPMPNASGVNSQYNFGIAKSAGTNARVLQVDEVLYYLIKREY